jgi:hypothetical protein
LRVVGAIDCPRAGAGDGEAVPIEVELIVGETAALLGDKAEYILGVMRGEVVCVAALKISQLSAPEEGPLLTMCALELWNLRPVVRCKSGTGPRGMRGS